MMNGTNEEYRNKVDLLVMYNELYEENEKLKQDNEEQTKTYQKILQEQQTEIDNLQRNCDLFNEQMNDAVERAMELQKQLQAYKDKEDKLREIFKDYNIEKPASGLSQCTYEITAEEMYKILQILNEGGGINEFCNK